MQVDATGLISNCKRIVALYGIQSQCCYSPHWYSIHRHHLHTLMVLIQLCHYRNSVSVQTRVLESRESKHKSGTRTIQGIMVKGYTTLLHPR